ncbi:hypothetical protein [Lacimicrobium alkaliphilum]|uniref:Uncharacterized protein n=1 Tax=Lacimicrobium alkaliphilum TaxID=1526571 RepID=A0ABQ1REB9_9ALTE|nr:hypothetical protein [Lacimicrobium alkaliphilum]GGD63889.1 hypothetical protein GCM10011357_19070 [Lacimicrobium alkaliphilum]
MSREYQCWHCGEALTDLILPLSRRETCAHCQADQHVCKMCEHFGPRGCEEERAESPSDTEKANFCDYFKPTTDAYKGGYVDKSRQAKAELAALFGDEPPQETDKQQPANMTPAEIAEEKLRKMLGGGD